MIEAQPGDVLMLDNSLAAHCVVRHGGRPLEFAREYPSEVSLALADPMWCDDAPPNGAHPADHQ